MNYEQVKEKIIEISYEMCYEKNKKKKIDLKKQLDTYIEVAKNKLQYENNSDKKI